MHAVCRVTNLSQKVGVPKVSEIKAARKENEKYIAHYICLPTMSLSTVQIHLQLYMHVAHTLHRNSCLEISYKEQAQFLGARKGLRSVHCVTKASSKVVRSMPSLTLASYHPSTQTRTSFFFFGRGPSSQLSMLLQMTLSAIVDLCSTRYRLELFAQKREHNAYITMCAFDWSIQTASRRTGKHERFETAISAHTDSVNLYPSLSSVKENGSKCLLYSLSSFIILTFCDGRKGGNEMWLTSCGTSYHHRYSIPLASPL